MRYSILGLAFAGLILVPGATMSAPADPRPAAPAPVRAASPAAQPPFSMESLDPSVLRVVVFNGDQLIALGSGIVIGRGDGGVYVATNYHVIDGGSANGIRVLAPVRDDPDEESGRPRVVERQAEYRRSDTGRNKDIAILFVPGLDRPPVVFLEGALSRDSEVRALGYPYTDLVLWRQLQARPWITSGRVSALERESIKDGGLKVDQIAHTADLNSGMSGGPLVDTCSRLLGLNTAVLDGANGANIAVGVSDVRRLAQELGATVTSDGGSCGPDVPEVRPAGATPAEAVNTRNAGGIPSWSIWAVIGLMVSALGGAGFVFWRRRKAVSTAAPCPAGLLLIGVGDAVLNQQRALGRADLEVGAEVGRQPGFGIEATSRRHAIITWQGTGFVIRDVGSLNGTTVNGREIRGLGDQPLIVGDFVTLGDRSASFRIQSL